MWNMFTVEWLVPGSIKDVLLGWKFKRRGGKVEHEK